MPARQSARRDRSLDRGRSQDIPVRTARIGHRAPTPLKWRDPKIVGSNPTGPATPAVLTVVLGNLSLSGVSTTRSALLSSTGGSRISLFPLDPRISYPVQPGPC